MSFPPTHALVAVGLAEVIIAIKSAPRWRVWGVAALLGVMPDFDIILGLLLGRGASLHGTLTHSLSAVAIAALVGYAFGGGRWAAIAGTAYGSHLLVDMLDDRGPTNLMLGWPFTDARPDAIGPFFPRVPMSGNGVIDTALNLLRPEPLVKLVAQTLLGVMIFLVLAGIARVLRRRGAATAPAR